MPSYQRYSAYGIGAIMAYFIVNGPDNSLQSWAKPHALRELAEEDEIFAAYAAVRARDLGAISG